FELKVAPWIVNAACLGLTPYLWAQGLAAEEGLTPDVLLACLLLWYLALIWRRPRTVRAAAAAGLCAGVAYLSKSYAFPFFAVHILGTAAFELWTVRRRQIRKLPPARLAAACLCFALPAAPWAALLSERYGELTFGT